MVEPVRVVTGGDEELAHGLVTDSVDGQQGRGNVFEDGLDVGESSRASWWRDRHRRATVFSVRLAATSTVVATPRRHRWAFLRSVMPAS